MAVQSTGSRVREKAAGSPPPADAALAPGAATPDGPGGSAALSSTTGLSPALFACKHQPRTTALVSSDGQMVGLRCNRLDCDGCWRRNRWERVSAMHYDAAHELPDALLTLTTADPNTTGDAINRGMARITEWLRRRYGKQVAYLALAEWTTGQTRWSGGHRRIHLHVLVKLRVADYDLAEIEREVARIWQHNTGATRVHLAGLQSPGGVLAYLGGLHHTKQSQRPPAHLHRVRTFRASRNYWVHGRDVTFAAAHAEQTDRRTVHRARKMLGPDADAQLVELEVAAMKLEQANRHWTVAPITQWVDPAGELHIERTDDVWSDLRQHRRRLSSESGPTIAP